MAPTVVTAAGPGGLPSLAVLAESVREHLPGSSLLALAPTATAAPDGVELVALDDLEAVGVDRAELHRRAAFSGATELLTSLKPALLQLALARGAEIAVWIHPDVELHAGLDLLIERAVADGVALVPTMRSAPPDDGKLPDSRTIATEGLVSGSLIAVAASGVGPTVLDWWAARARRDCLLDPPAGLLLDRGWLAALPVLFDAGLVDDPGVGVGWLNLHERVLSAGPDGAVLVDGVPLSAFDASGLDPRRPWLLTVHSAGRGRTRLSTEPVLAMLVADRARRLVAADDLMGPDAESEWPYSVTAAGLPIDDGQRRAYRRALLEAEADDDGDGPASLRPPDPFDRAEPGAWLAWWAEPVGGTAAHPRNRWGELLLAERIDLRVHFAAPDGADAERFHEWVRTAGVAEGLVPDALVPVGVPELPAEPPSPGVNVVGFLGLDRGVGEAARLLADSVEAAGLPVCRLDLPDPGLPPGRRPLSVPSGPYDITLLSVNPNEVVLIDRSAAHRHLLEGRRTIGLWFWEVDRLPEFMQRAFDLVDEIWVASQYNAELFRKWTDLPVEVFPHPVATGGPTHVTRDDLGLPDGFLFGFFFDHLSLLERKNPVGLVDAYTRAFGPADGTVLVLKTINGDRRPDDVERLRLAIGDRPDIVVIDRHLSGVAMRALYAHIDAYVSLHRAEGFGQTMTAAMAHAKPVIATGFSANLDYMHADNAYLVSWRPTPVGDGSWPYPPDATWADPDLAEAAAWMRHVVEHPDDAAAKAQRAQRDIRERYSLGRAAAFVDERLARWW
jgi:glycosyltransferase involved in cell wall biosynthesis